MLTRQRSCPLDSENKCLYLFFKSQKMVAQPNPVATLRWDSGRGREAKNSLPHRPSCHVTRWLTAPGVKTGAAPPSVHSQPGTKEMSKVRGKGNDQQQHVLEVLGQ